MIAFKFDILGLLIKNISHVFTNWFPRNFSFWFPTILWAPTSVLVQRYAMYFYQPMGAPHDVFFEIYFHRKNKFYIVENLI